MWTKGIVIGIIGLFFGTSFTPAIITQLENKNDVSKIFPFLNQTNENTISLDKIQNGNTGPLDITTGLVAYWKFDESSGSIAYDSVGGYDGTLNGNPQWVPGKFGGALQFDGDGDFVTTPLNQLGAQTISLWFNVDNIAESKGTLISTHEKDDNTGNLAIAVSTYNCGVSVVCIDPGSSTSWWDPARLCSGPLYEFNDNNWHHLAFTHDGSGNYKLFIDSVLKDTYSGSPLTDIRPYVFGRHEPPNFNPSYYWYKGALDEVRIYNRALSESDIQELYTQGGTDWWPMFHHDLSHTGYSTSTGPGTNNVLWTYDTGDILYSSPAVANGNVYVGSSNCKVFCLNADTGAKIWEYTTAGSVFSSPAVANGNVYVGSNDDKMYCLNADTGEKIWEYTTGEQVTFSSPTIANSKVYVGSGDGKIYCLNADTGALIWSYQTGFPIRSSPAVSNGKVYIGAYDSMMYCFNADTGALIWTYTTGDNVFSSPAIVNGKVYVGSDDYKVWCLNADTGTAIWTYTTGDIVGSSPAVANGKVYVGSNDGKIYFLNADTGALIWSYQTGSPIRSSPAVINGLVYGGSFDHMVWCLNADTGALIWTYTTGDYVYSSPAIADGKVYIGSWDHKMYCFGSGGNPLVAEAGGPYSGTVETPVQLSGSATGGTPPYSYAWDLDNDGLYDDATGATPSYTSTNAGIYPIGLRVTDNAAATSTDTAQVTITSGLVAEAGGPYSGTVDQSITFTGSASGGTSPYQYRWDWTNDGTYDTSYSSSNTASHSYSSAGSYTVKLQIKDNTGATATDTAQVTITSGLVAEAGGPYSGTVDQSITFTGSASGGTSPYQYRWDWTNDGTYDTSYSSSNTASHSYSSAGSYTVKLQIKDNTGATATDAAQVTISSGIVAPAVTTNAATGVGDTTATLNGNLDGMGNAASCEVWFEYGTTTSYGTSTAHQMKTSTGVFSQSISTLTKGTLYHFRAVAKNTAGTIFSTIDRMFTTTNINVKIQSVIFTNEKTEYGAPVYARGDKVGISITLSDNTVNLDYVKLKIEVYNSYNSPNNHDGEIVLTKTNFIPPLLGFFGCFSTYYSSVSTADPIGIWHVNVYLYYNDVEKDHSDNNRFYVIFERPAGISDIEYASDMGNLQSVPDKVVGDRTVTTRLANLHIFDKRIWLDGEYGHDGALTYIDGVTDRLTAMNSLKNLAMHKASYNYQADKNKQAWWYDTLTFLAKKTGVCTDFAGLDVAYARAVGIPARDISGWFQEWGSGSQEGHDWEEAWTGLNYDNVDAGSYYRSYSATPSWDDDGHVTKHYVLEEGWVFYGNNNLVITMMMTPYFSYPWNYYLFDLISQSRLSTSISVNKHGDTLDTTIRNNGLLENDYPDGTGIGQWVVDGIKYDDQFWQILIKTTTATWPLHYVLKLNQVLTYPFKFDPKWDDDYRIVVRYQYNGKSYVVSDTGKRSLHSLYSQGNSGSFDDVITVESENQKHFLDNYTTFEINHTGNKFFESGEYQDNNRTFVVENQQEMNFTSHYSTKQYTLINTNNRTHACRLTIPCLSPGDTVYIPTYGTINSDTSLNNVSTNYIVTYNQGDLSNISIIAFSRDSTIRNITFIPVTNGTASIIDLSWNYTMSPMDETQITMYQQYIPHNEKQFQEIYEDLLQEIDSHDNSPITINIDTPSQINSGQILPIDVNIVNNGLLSETINVNTNVTYFILNKPLSEYSIYIDSSTVTVPPQSQLLVHYNVLTYGNFTPQYLFIKVTTDKSISAIKTVEVQPCFDVGISIPDTVNQNTDFLLNLIVTNIGDQTIHNININEINFNNLFTIKSSPSENIFDLAAHESKILTWTLNANASGILPIEIKVYSDDGGSYQETIRTNSLSFPNIDVNYNPEYYIQPYQSFNLQVIANNTGDQTAHNTQLTIILPENVTCDSPIKYIGDLAGKQNTTVSWQINPNVDHNFIIVINISSAQEQHQLFIMVYCGKQHPIAIIDCPDNGGQNELIQFNGSFSYDIDGSIISYIWNFGDGNTGNGAIITHAYTYPGSYLVTLTVEDNDGLIGTDATYILIGNNGNAPSIQLLYPQGGETLKDTVTIKWFAHDNEDGFNLPIYIYYSTDNGKIWSPFTNNPQKNTGEYSWDTTKLPDGEYLLQISAMDSDYNLVSDTSDQFQIRNHEVPPVNNEPVKPTTPSGSTNGKIKQQYSYTTSTSDPDGDQVYYFWDWGNGNNSGWLGPYNSGATINTPYSWTIKGSYSIKVKAKDIYGKESSWSNPLPIIMPYSFNRPLLQFLELLFQRFPNAFPLLRHLLGY